VKRKVCVVVTARPSYSRIKTALLALRDRSDVELQLVIAASAVLDRYGNVIKVIQADGLEIASRVHMVLEGETLLTSAKTTGLGLMELATVFDTLKPDVVVTIADRYETIATAIAASYMNIPLVHIQGGEITGSIDEKVRHAITKLADYHFVASHKAAERVIRMGEDANSVFVTGCPSIDLASQILSHPKMNFNPFEKYGGVGATFNPEEGYLVVMQHPVTTEAADARRQITETIQAIQQINMPTFWFWPNVDAGSENLAKGIRAYRELHRAENIHFFKNMHPEDFLRLLYNSKQIVGNSSVAIRECAFLGVPAVNIGTRQSGRDRGLNVIDVDYDSSQITNAIRRHLDMSRPASDSLYGDGTAGEKIAELLATLPLKYLKRLTY
jgi:UDP-hydrolysing UDP-N-acetyl-D-glucosamine 2-epimerase